MLNTIDTLSREELNLFNPYYCSVLLYNLLNTEESKDNDGLDCSLLFLTLPLIMSREVNECMPYTKKQHSIHGLTIIHGYSLDSMSELNTILI